MRYDLRKERCRLTAFFKIQPEVENVGGTKYMR